LIRMKTKIKTAREKAEKAELKKLGLSNLYPKFHLFAKGEIHVSFGGAADREIVEPERQLSPSPKTSHPPKSQQLEC